MVDLKVLNPFELPKVDVGNRETFKNRLEKWAYFFKKEGLLSEEE